jgi:hypothetical protein
VQNVYHVLLVWNVFLLWGINANSSRFVRILEYSIDPIPPGAVCKNSAIIAVPSAKCASIGLGKLVTKNYLADEALSKPAGKSKSNLLDTVRGDCNQPRSCHVQAHHP